MLFEELSAVVCGSLRSGGKNWSWGQMTKMPTRNHALIDKLNVGATGFEPVTPCSQSREAAELHQQVGKCTIFSIVQSVWMTLSLLRGLVGLSAGSSTNGGYLDKGNMPICRD